MKPIGFVQSGHHKKFSIPKQSQMTSFESVIQLKDEARPGLLGLAKMSHIWVLFEFHQNAVQEKESPFLVKPPALGGNETMGVFATRASFRPNSIGMSLVELVDVDEQKGRLIVRGLDCVNETPVIDIKPFHPMADVPKSKVQTGWIQKEQREFVTEFACDVDADKRKIVKELLSNAIEPGYHQLNGERVYHTEYDNLEISWRADQKENTVVRTVVEIKS